MSPFVLLLVRVIVKFVDVQQIRIGGKSQPFVADERNAHVLKVVQCVQGLAKKNVIILKSMTNVIFAIHDRSLATLSSHVTSLA